MTAPERSEEYGSLQRLMDTLFARSNMVTRLEAIILAESNDLHSDLQELVALLPPGHHTRQQMADQLNSAIAGHGWGMKYGTVE